MKIKDLNIFLYVFTPLEFSDGHLFLYFYNIMTYHSLDYKLSAIKYYKKIKNYSLVSRIFDCKRTTLIRWVYLYDNNKLKSNHNKFRKSYKITEKHVEYIKKNIYFVLIKSFFFLFLIIIFIKKMN